MLKKLIVLIYGEKMNKKNKIKFKTKEINKEVLSNIQDLSL